MTGWKRWAIAVGTLVAGAIVTVLALHSPEGLKSAASVGGLVAALTPLVLSLVVWARRPPLVALPNSTIEQTDAAQRQLASQVLRQWRDEISVRQLDDPGPLAVRWRFTELDVVARPKHVSRGSSLRLPFGRGRPRFTGRTDRIAEMAEEFRKLPRRRLVILGEPGMGKTTLALLLLRELLEHAEPGDPVPVFLSMSGWDPRTESLPEWLARRLAEDYPALRAAVFGPDAARSLVTRRKILPILDGLDELPDTHRSAVLIRLNEAAADPLVLTCRTAEYQAAVTAWGGDTLTGGVVIEPKPLTPADAASYIAGCLGPGTGDTWRPLLATLRNGAGSPVSNALSSPLALWLLRKVYIDTRADPTGLCDTSRFPTTDTIIEHLLDHLVDALIRANPPRQHGDEHPFRPRRAWNPADAMRWLMFLAHHVSTIGGRDLAWWHLHRAIPDAAAIPTGVVAGLTLTLVGGLLTGLESGLTAGLIIGPTVGLVFGLVVGLARGLTVGHVLGLVFGLNLLSISIGAAFFVGEPVVGLTFASAATIFILVVGLLAARAVGFIPADRPAYADLRLRGRTRLLLRKLTGWAEGGLALRFFPGFTVGLVFGSILALANAVPNGMVFGLVLGLVFGLCAWIAIGVIAWAETPITDERPLTPVVTFHRDLRLVYVKALTGGVALGVAFGVQDMSMGLNGPRSGLSVGVTVAVAIAFGVGLHHRLGILRQCGPIYQFRHAKLQDRLAEGHDQPGHHAPKPVRPVGCEREGS